MADCKVKFFPTTSVCGQPCDVLFWPDGKPLTVSDAEQKLNDSVAQEINKHAGTDVELYELDLKNSVVDPLFRETVKRIWKGPFKLKAYVEWADSTPEVREEGFRTSFASRAWIARADIEAINAEPPAEGDILRFWNIPFFNESGVDGEPVPGRGYFFNVVDVDDDGHNGDGANFTGFWLTLQRRTDFPPEVRLKG
jgi:hypothetical protein